MLIKKITTVICIIVMTALTAGAVGTPSVSAGSAIIINGDTGEVVFEKDADVRRSMASTTKIMTSLIAAESGRLDEVVSVTAEMTGVEGTSIGLKAGYKITLRNLVYGMLLESGNDAANATAVFLAGSQTDFAALMNQKAKEIGMTSSNFVTPSGLDDENHYTTARDMAILGAYAMKNPTMREISSTKSKQINMIEPDITVTFSNHNRLLRSYEGAFGVKTGFTKKSGRCLVSAAERDGAGFIAVTLNAGDDWNDHKKMFDYAFAMVQREKIKPNIPKAIAVQGSATSEIKIKAVASSYLNSYTFNKTEITQKVYLPTFVYAPVKKGDRIGYVEFYRGDELVMVDDVVATQDAQCIAETYVPKRSLLEKIKEKLKQLFSKEKAAVTSN